MPNRVIKDSIRTSKKINALTDFQFRLWLYLITYVDDYGRGMADPELLKGFVFPRRKRVTESDIEKGLADLAGMGCIHLYQVDGDSYFCFPNWGEHQRIQNKRAKYPEPPTIENGNLPYSAEDDDNLPSVTVSHGEPLLESKPIQSESETESDILSRACAPDTPPVICLPLTGKQEYPVLQSQVDGWKELYPAVDILQELRKMKGWLEANPSRRKTKTGILRFVTGWLSKEQDKPRAKNPQSRQASYDLSAFDELALFGGGKG